MKIVGITKCFNEGENGNLERCLKNLSAFCDEIIVCDNTSTDNSLEIAKKYTKNIIIQPDDFKAELLHKQKMLEMAVSLGATHIVHLDPDEILDQLDKIKELCEKMDKNNIDGIWCHLKNLWLSDKMYRVNDQFNGLWKCCIWRNNGRLKFPETMELHHPQHPNGIEKTYHSNISIIHYGFSTRALIERKIKTYEELGQSGWALKRLSPDNKAKLVPLNGCTCDVVYEALPIDCSVGIPAYIKSDRDLIYLRICINSVLEQTYNGLIEIIVVDDGSPQEFGEQIKNICKTLNVRYCKNEQNLGIGATRNYIIKEAHGKYLAQISADDCYVPYYIDTMVSNAKDDAFLYASCFIINEHGIFVQVYNVPMFASDEAFSNAVVESARNNRMFINYNLFAPTKLWRENMFWDDKRFGEDLAHLLECLFVKKVKFAQIITPLFYYRIHQQMTTTIESSKIPANNLDTFKRINNQLEKALF